MKMTPMLIVENVVEDFVHYAMKCPLYEGQE